MYPSLLDRWILIAIPRKGPDHCFKLLCSNFWPRKIIRSTQSRRINFNHILLRQKSSSSLESETLYQWYQNIDKLRLEARVVILWSAYTSSTLTIQIQIQRWIQIILVCGQWSSRPRQELMFLFYEIFYVCRLAYISLTFYLSAADLGAGTYRSCSDLLCHEMNGIDAFFKRQLLPNHSFVGLGKLGNALRCTNFISHAMPKSWRTDGRTWVFKYGTKIDLWRLGLLAIKILTMFSAD